MLQKHRLMLPKHRPMLRRHLPMLRKQRPNLPILRKHRPMLCKHPLIPRKDLQMLREHVVTESEDARSPNHMPTLGVPALRWGVAHHLTPQLLIRKVRASKRPMKTAIQKTTKSRRRSTPPANLLLSLHQDPSQWTLIMCRARKR